MDQIVTPSVISSPLRFKFPRNLQAASLSVRFNDDARDEVGISEMNVVTLDDQSGRSLAIPS